MDDSSQFMQWAMDMLQHENPPSSAAVHDDFSEATFPSLKALRETSQEAEMVQEVIAGADDVVRHAPNSCDSGGGGDTTANYNVPTGWNLGGATSTQQPSRNGMMEALLAMATRGLPPPDLVYGGPPPTRRAGLKSLGSMAESYAQDHIIAERKRREKINQRFIELSAVIPGLKKMDKATILLEATRYLKELQEKVKDLEAGRSTETLVLVRKPCLHAAAARGDDDGSSLSAPPEGTSTAMKRLPEIQVRFSESEKSVVVRVHCENGKGVVVNVLTEIEELHLSSIHANVMPFTACTCIITITAKASFPCPFD